MTIPRLIMIAVLVALVVCVSGCALTTSMQLDTPIADVTRDTHTTISTERLDFAPK